MRAGIGRGRPARWAAWLLAGMVALAAAGCSMVKLGYENLPMLVVWEVSGVLDLDANQKRIVERHAAEIREWHRRRQLPEYVRFIADAEAGLERAPGPETITQWRERLLASWYPLAERLAPAVAELGVTLRPAQLARLDDEFARLNRETRAEYKVDAPREVRERARRERFEKRAESLLGYLTDEQRQLIRTSSSSVSDERAWWALREARQRMFSELLARLARERPDPERAASMARETLTGLYWAVDADVRASIERRAEAADALAAQLLQRSSVAQRRKLVETLRGYGNDFATLAARAG
ncbi:MAG: DUF6279 family lipoprotein [Lautropia sp.]